VKYQALMAGEVDIIDAYSTDGLLGRYAITVLEDDRQFFPPYDAAALVRGTLARERPAAVAALAELSGRIDVVRMRRWNARVEVNGEDAAVVAREARVELGLAAAASGGDAAGGRAGSGPGGPDRSVMAYLWERRAALGGLAARHLSLVGTSLVAAILVAVPLGLALSRSRAAPVVLRTVGVLQTIPGLALLAFLLPVMGIGFAPAVTALFLYSLYPIVQNTWTGVLAAA
jgi:osmoprotectant transport system permease protein